jgi:hypothetical protein
MNARCQSARREQWTHAASVVDAGCDTKLMAQRERRITSRECWICCKPRVVMLVILLDD